MSSYANLHWGQLALVGLNLASILALAWWGGSARARLLRDTEQWWRAWGGLQAELATAVADRDALKKQWLAAVRELRGDERAQTVLWQNRKPTVFHAVRPSLSAGRPGHDDSAVGPLASFELPALE
jgi:hypothetical protein